MENNLAKIAAYQAIKGVTEGESICHSAVLKCDFGSKECVLNLPRSHGKHIGNSAQIDKKDGKNVYFGFCKKLDGPCEARLSDWYNGNIEDQMFDESTLRMESSVQKGISFMICTATRKG